MTAIPTYKINEERLDKAWQAYKALQMDVKSNPELLDNEYHGELREAAFSWFVKQFEVA